METTPLISVIVPIYNISEYLNRCVNSICTQTYSNLEIILVDDGSPDNCPQLCDAWKEKDPRVLVIHKPNGGLSDARNAGMKIAQGEYISFVDGDDWLEKDFFSILTCIMNENGADIAEVGFRHCVEGEKYENISPMHESICLNRDEAMANLIENKIPQVVWNKLYKKDIITDIPFEIGKYHEDEFWTYQVIDRVKTYVRSEYVGYNYFQRKGSIMGVGYSLKRLDAIEAKVRRQRYLEDNKSFLAELARKNLLFACMYHGQCADRELNTQERKKAFSILKVIYHKHKMSSNEFKKMRFSQRIWIKMAQISLKLTCAIRNKLNIGL